MLREVRSSYLKPRLLGLAYTRTASAVTVGQGVGSVTGVAGATGIATLTWTRGFARSPIVVTTPSTADVAAGSSIISASAPTSTGEILQTLTSAGAGDNGTGYVGVLGYDSNVTSPGIRYANVARGEMDQTKIIALRVNTASPGTVTINSRAVFSLTRTGTGDVTLTLRQAFANSGFVALATAVSNTGVSVGTDVTDSKTVRIKTFTAGGTTPADALVNVILIGDGQGTSERVAAGPLMNDQRKPLLFGYSVGVTAGVPSLLTNSGDVTIADTGTGVIGITFRQAFRREPIIVSSMIYDSTSNNVIANVGANSSASAFEIRTYASGGATLTDSALGGGPQIIGVGWDDPSEY